MDKFDSETIVNDSILIKLRVPFFTLQTELTLQNCKNVEKTSESWSWDTCNSGSAFQQQTERFVAQLVTLDIIERSSMSNIKQIQKPTNLRQKTDFFFLSTSESIKWSSYVLSFYKKLAHQLLDFDQITCLGALEDYQLLSTLC